MDTALQKMSNKINDLFDVENPLKNQWVIPGDITDPQLIAKDDMDDLSDDLDPRIMGSTSYLVEQSNDPWEKYKIITNSAVFRNVSYSVSEHKRLHDEYSVKFSQASRDLNDAIYSGDDYDASHIYPLAHKALYHYEQHKLLQEYRDDYLNLIAAVLQGSVDHIVSDIELSDDQMGDLGGMVAQGVYETGSRKWHEVRMNSMGGSDMGTLCSGGIFHKENMDRLWETKIAGMSEKDLAESLDSHRGTPTDPLSRGNAMEDVIGVLYGIATGKNIGHNKTTWLAPSGLEHINLDYVETDDDGNYLAPVEIKNVNDSTYWGDPSDGIDGVPDDYRAQVLSQAYLTGASQGTVVALMGGVTMKAYHFTMTPELYVEAEKNSMNAQKFMDSVWKARKEYCNTAVIPPRETVIPTVRKGIPKNATRTQSINKDKFKFFTKLATLGDKDVQDIEKMFIDLTGDDLSPQRQEEVFNTIYSTISPQGTYIGIDLETNASSPVKGNVIECGIIAYDMDTGKEYDRLSQLYSPTATSLEVQGMGEESIHHITENMVGGLSPLSTSDDKQKDILDFIISHGGKLVAHNATFEKGFLRGHVAGFAEAEARGDIVFIDTQDITRDVLDTPQNRLEDFVTHHGIDYVDAHRAENDVAMMMEALYRWFCNNQR